MLLRRRWRIVKSVAVGARPDDVVVRERVRGDALTTRGESSSPEIPAQRRILIVDKHPLVRHGLTALIDNEPDLIVCAEAATHREALEAIASPRPDLEHFHRFHSP